MLIIKFLRLIFSTLTFLVKIFGLAASTYLAFNLPYAQLLIFLPVLNFGAWIAVKLIEFLNDQFLEIQCSLKNLYKIRDENLKLDTLSETLKEKEQYLKEAEHFLAAQVEKHNQAKMNLKKEVHDYHQELVNDFILKNSKSGTDH